MARLREKEDGASAADNSALIGAQTMSDDPGDSKRQKAVALKYAVGEGAPRVIATGAGEIAKRIIELAQENNIPIQQDESLTSILSKLDLGFEIPPETYRVVAEILAFLYKTDDEWRKKKEAQGLKVPLLDLEGGEENHEVDLLNSSDPVSIQPRKDD